MGVINDLYCFSQNAKVKVEGAHFLNYLKKICDDPKANIAAKAIACNLILTYQ